MPTTVEILGESSYHLRSGRAEGYVTARGGHLGPVRFGNGVSPFHVAPWSSEPVGSHPAIIQVLRGDFFCMPFGANSTPFGGETHPIHGETANERWDLTSQTDEELVLTLRPSIRPCRVEKKIRLTENAVYSRHRVSEGAGPMTIGHHAMLSFATEGLVSLSHFGYGQVYPFEFENPAQGGYSCLRQGARFTDLAEVPMADGGLADLTRYPARDGFEDLVMVFTSPEVEVAWSAVVFPAEGYLWLSLRDPRVLTGTLLWHSNGGRHYAPWNGRHRRVLGVEEITGFFHTGLAESAAPNEASRAGWRTHVDLCPDEPLEVSTIMAVANVPPSFDHVRAVTADGGGVRVVSRSEQVVEIPLDLGFLRP